MVKNPPASVRDKDSIPALGGSPGVASGNSMDRGAWQAYSPWGHNESNMTEQAHTQAYFRLYV